MDPILVPISKFLSLVLRHKPEILGLSLSDAGWVRIKDLIAAAKAHGRELNLDLLLRAVHENDKQRFAISPDGESIRANQGHSVNVDLALEPAEPPPVLFHGTVARFLGSICENGLVPGERQHVHLSADQGTAEAVGRRRGQPIVLTVKARGMADAGFNF